MKQLIIASPFADIQKIDALLKNRETKEWIYFGNDFQAFSSVERKLASDYTWINTIELYKKVADDIRADYVAWIDELNARYGDDIEWWVGSVFSRNNYSSDLFQYACYLEILDRLLSKQGILPDLLFVESLGLAESIRNWAVKKDISVHTDRGSFTVHDVKAALRPLLDWFRFVVVSKLRWAAAFISKIRCRTKNTLPENSVIIHTFVHDNSLTKDGVFVNRYLPFLCDYASAKGFRISIHPVLHGFKYRYLPFYTRMRQSKLSFMVREDFLRLPDYIAALTYPLRSLKKRIEIKSFRSFDLSRAISRMRRQECFSTGMNALLTYRLFLRLKEAGLKPSLLVLWYENQPIDKAIIAAMRRYFPQIKIIGSQILLHPPNFLNLYPAQSEVRANVAPDTLIETSPHQCGRARAFTSDIPCKVGAALRYTHTFDNDRYPHVTEGEKAVLLVALPFYTPESMEMLAVLKNALGSITHDVKILIKVHPDCSAEIIKNKFGESEWPQTFSFFEGSLAEGLKKALIVISANSSSMIEALTYGIPAIYLGSRIMINQNVLKDLNEEITRECYTAQELADAINKYIELYPAKRTEYREMGRRIRDQYFTPVSEETLAPFLDIGRTV